LAAISAIGQDQHGNSQSAEQTAQAGTALPPGAPPAQTAGQRPAAAETALPPGQATAQITGQRPAAAETQQAVATSPEENPGRPAVVTAKGTKNSVYWLILVTVLTLLGAL
jgi:hypothetical protein